MPALFAISLAITLSAAVIYFPCKRAIQNKWIPGYILSGISALLCGIGILGWSEYLFRENLYPTFIPLIALLAGWLVAGIALLSSMLWNPKKVANKSVQTRTTSGPV